jgi:hypothetical protein
VRQESICFETKPYSFPYTIIWVLILIQLFRIYGSTVGASKSARRAHMLGRRGWGLEEHSAWMKREWNGRQSDEMPREQECEKRTRQLGWGLGCKGARRAHMPRRTPGCGWKVVNGRNVDGMGMNSTWLGWNGDNICLPLECILGYLPVYKCVSRYPTILGGGFVISWRAAQVG